jgi:hypothetical protein
MMELEDMLGLDSNDFFVRVRVPLSINKPTLYKIYQILYNVGYSITQLRIVRFYLIKVKRARNERSSTHLQFDLS